MPDLFLELRDESGRDTGELEPMTESEALAFLSTADLSGMKLIPWGSNYSFAVALEDDDGRAQLGIYKPEAGEAPLYDFPNGTLYRREVASFVLSSLLGWSLVPPTVLREGPHGIGSLQLYIQPGEQDDSWDPHAFWGANTLEIERLVLFDHLSNNADRKLSHCLRDASGKVWGIDHGLTFNEMPKLRTVLWQFVGCAIREELVEDLVSLRSDEERLCAAFEQLLLPGEVRALITRIDMLLTTGRYPRLNPNRNVPYGWW